MAEPAPPVPLPPPPPPPPPTPPQPHAAAPTVGAPPHAPPPQHQLEQHQLPLPPQPQPQPQPRAHAAARSPRSAQPRTPQTPRGALQEDNLHTLMLRIDRYAQSLLDRVAPFKLYRWVSLIALVTVFLLRVFIVRGFYVVTYCLFIFILQQFILFLQPKDRATLVAKAAAVATTSDSPPDESDADARAELPMLDDEEFRPFVRRLPEFKFWYSATHATFLAFCMTFIPFFDIPVFWPLLVVYFLVLFIATMRRQWLDMKRLKYVPWDIGAKKVYRSDPKRVSVSTARNDAPVDVVASSRAPPPVPTIAVQQKKGAPQSAPNTQPAATSAAPTARA